MSPKEKAEMHRDSAAFWDDVAEAVDQEKSPLRERMVVLVNMEYIATHRWEINPNNGWVTVQLRDGSILPVRPGNWSLAPYAEDHFDIGRKEIQVDDPDR